MVVSHVCQIQILILLLRLIIGSQFQYTAHLDQLTNESSLVSEIVDVVVLEEVKVGRFRVTFDNYWQNLGCIQLDWSVEIDLS